MKTNTMYFLLAGVAMLAYLAWRDDNALTEIKVNREYRGDFEPLEFITVDAQYRGDYEPQGKLGLD